MVVLCLKRFFKGNQRLSLYNNKEFEKKNKDEEFIVSTDLGQLIMIRCNRVTCKALESGIYSEI